MKCHLCLQDLTPEPYANWHVGNRKSISYQCRNNSCSSQTGGRHLVVLNMILPDNITEDYTLPITMNDKWYWIFANSRGGHHTALWMGNSLTMNLNRFYPILMEDDLSSKVEFIMEKLKTLLLFI